MQSTSHKKAIQFLLVQFDTHFQSFKPTEAHVTSWSDTLNDFDAATIVKAARFICKTRTNDFVCTPGRVREVCVDIKFGGLPSGEEAWTMLGYNSEEVLHRLRHIPFVKKVFRAWAAGICRDKRATEVYGSLTDDELPWRRKEFISLYNHMLDKQKTNHVLRAIEAPTHAEAVAVLEEVNRSAAAATIDTQRSKLRKLHKTPIPRLADDEDEVVAGCDDQRFVLKSEVMP